MATLLRDLIDIPERTSADDYVLRLSESVDDHAAAALDHYVVTDQLAGRLRRGARHRRRALATGESQGAYLAGSFGSGKSHFMAVLHALLRDDPAARAKAELRQVVARQDDGSLAEGACCRWRSTCSARSRWSRRCSAGTSGRSAACTPTRRCPRVHQSDGLLVDAERAARPASATSGSSPGSAATGRSQRRCLWAGQPRRRPPLDRADVRRGAAAARRRTSARAPALVDRAGRRTTSALTPSRPPTSTWTPAWPRSPRTRRASATTPSSCSSTNWCCGWRSRMQRPRVLPPRVAEAHQAGREPAGGRARSRWSRSSPGRSTCAAGSPTRAPAAPSRRRWSRRSATRRAASARSQLGDDNLPYVAHQRLLPPADDTPQAEQLDAAFARLDRSPGGLGRAARRRQHRRPAPRLRRARRSG